MQGPKRTYQQLASHLATRDVASAPEHQTEHDHGHERAQEVPLGARRAGPGGASFVLPFIHLPVTIDHIVAPEGFDGGAKVMPRLGSDHRGVFAWLDRAPQ